MEKDDTVQLNDSELILRCQAGDDSAFDVLYLRYKRPLYSYILNHLPTGSSDADDVFQKTWIQAVRNLARYTDRQIFLGWLCRIAHNACMDVYRRKVRKPEEELGDTEPMYGEASAPETIQRREMEAALESAILSLPTDQREIILKRREGKSFKEIADEQKESINTVLGRMRYAVLKLKSLLTDFME